MICGNCGREDVALFCFCNKVKKTSSEIRALVTYKKFELGYKMYTKLQDGVQLYLGYICKMEISWNYSVWVMPLHRKLHNSSDCRYLLAEDAYRYEMESN